ncbi:AAA family ATPase [Nocardia thailandica]|uniref:AAA family ATPase n=1 Tax=Nocardia thailandica TaxID=257275 RepID=UPI0002F42194|nr:AAA family ATPase [Nocardia thailandica]
MTPPLDAVHFPDPPAGKIIAPAAVLDLRGDEVTGLRYPAAAVVVFAGVPGAGKSTALQRFFGVRADAEAPVAATALVLDSHQARNRLRHRLGRLPYPLWRPVVHVAHYRALRTALRTEPGPVALHDCATFGWSRRLITGWARHGGRPVHMVLIDVPAEQARTGQHARGRRVNGLAFLGHCRRWERLMRDLGARDRAAIAGPELLGAASVVIVDRPALDRLRRFAFHPSPADGAATGA